MVPALIFPSKIVKKLSFSSTQLINTNDSEIRNKIMVFHEMIAVENTGDAPREKGCMGCCT